MTTNRRELLILTATATAAAACPMALTGCARAKETLNVGKAAEFAAGVTKVDGDGILVGKDAGGLYAPSART